MKKHTLRISNAEHYYNRTPVGRWYRNMIIARAAHRDAKKSTQRRVHALAGKFVEKNIPWDEANNPKHRTIALKARLEGLAEDLAAFRKRVEDFAKHVRPWRLLCVFLLLVCLETLGNSLITRDMGTDGLERWIFALLLSIAVFLMVFFTGEHKTKGSKIWYWLTITALACVVVAITLLRLTRGTEQLAYVIAEGVIFGTCTIGAAVGSHRVFDVWRTASPEWRAIITARRHLKERQQVQAAAEAEKTIVQDTAEWRGSQMQQITDTYENAWHDAI